MLSSRLLQFVFTMSDIPPARDAAPSDVLNILGKIPEWFQGKVSEAHEIAARTACTAMENLVSPLLGHQSVPLRDTFDATPVVDPSPEAARLPTEVDLPEPEPCSTKRPSE